MSTNFVTPAALSNKAVRRAGKRIATGGFTADDEEVVQRWRDSHAYVLNVFQTTLRRWIRGEEITLVQRLKRLATIRDKLATGRAVDVSTMHDLAGCRLIFPDLTTLTAFRDEFHSKTRAMHEYVSPGKYDYIENPKETGYRGIHDIYRYKVADGSTGAAWNGLRIEIQYRTQAQHAWATAVEISDVIDGERVKFDKGANAERERLFLLCSELIARVHEHCVGFEKDLSLDEVRDELNAIDGHLGVINRLRTVARSVVDVPKSKNLVLVFGDGLQIDGFRSMKQALDYRNFIEFAHPDYDAVFVRAEKPAEVAGAFRNYFRDSNQFIALLDSAL